MLALVVALPSCSDFYMPTNGTALRLSVRTMDLGIDGGWNLSAVPKGLLRAQEDCPPARGKALTWTSAHGYVGFSAPSYGFPVSHAIGEALNERGLSCGALALTPSKMPEASAELPNVHTKYFCQWAAEMFATVDEVKAALSGKVQLYGHAGEPGQPGLDYTHWVLRDASGRSLVVEAAGIDSADGKIHLHDDFNDGGATGFGIMTNEPTFEYHLANVRHLEWKRTLVRQAVTVPGTYYPEERFLRVHMVKSVMPVPKTLQEGVAQAVATLNTVTVPMGEQYGTDSGKRSAEMGTSDHTLWGVVRDHATPTVYYRSAGNPSLQRVRLADLDLSPGAPPRSLSVAAGPWFHDVAQEMRHR